MQVQSKCQLDYYFVIDFRLREEGKERNIYFVVPLIYEFIGWFQDVLWPGIEPATLVYWNDALTN